MPDQTPDQQLVDLRKQLRDSELRCRISKHREGKRESVSVPFARRTKYDRTNLRKQIAELEQQIAQSK